MSAGQTPVSAAGPRPPECRNVILIGLRGSGKSAVAREVGRRLNWPVVDTDALLAGEAGRSIREIFEQEGEAGFRAREAEVLARVSGGTGQVLSVGGGAVLFAENRARLRDAGVCVWLTAPPETLHARTQADPQSAATRPGLTAAGGALDEERHLLAERGPLYAELAAHVVNTAGRSVVEVAADVLERLAGPGRPEAR